jgi:hypothetical protein
MKVNSMTFVPLGGLCNRMRAMASGVHLAKAMGCPIDIYWKKSNECLASFKDLFEPIRVDGLSVFPLTASRFYLYPDRMYNFYLPGKIRARMFDSQLMGSSKRLDDTLAESLRGRVYLASGYSLSGHYPINELFVPVPEIMEQVRILQSQFGERTYGIHIRRGDNCRAVLENSIADYFHFMDEKRAVFLTAKFYLATDSSEVRQTMRSRYGNCLISYDALLKRNALQGMKDAVVDLWCLSQTREIAGSYYSSFSEMAAEIGKISLVTSFSKSFLRLKE